MPLPRVYGLTQHFKHSILAFSQAIPHLAKVIPAMDKCEQFLTDCSSTKSWIQQHELPATS